jgi:hypothetical protein
MNASSGPQSQSQPQASGGKLRNTAIGALFALVLIVPRIMHLRRNPRSWMFFRVFLGIAGAALVLLPLGLGSSFVPAIVGLAMFISAILLPPARSDVIGSGQARELGALVVVNGGRFKLGDAPSFTAQLFVGDKLISVRDARLESFLEIPVAEITSAQAEESHGRWFLRVNWAGKTAVFVYRGVFAEHLARVAETTIRSVMRPALPVLPQRRAAGA